MTHHPPAVGELSINEIPAEWRQEARSRLQPDENVQAVLEVDLDAQLHFVRGLVVVTDRRILSHGPGKTGWQDWAYRTDLALQHHDHAGVGHLDLVDGQGLLASWRFTLGQNLQAIRVVEQFRLQLQSHLSGQPVVRPEGHFCPSCKAPLAPEQDECPICTKVIHTPPSTWTLLRLWRFARPYKGQLLLGFVLTLLGTAASLVPPYLTMPLMDEVLIPFQSGKQIAPELVAMYLGGLFLAAFVAWGLTWAKTYVLALVSERIGADLRTTTYDHLLRLSLEYFGGKRTGDLMARIGSETDRICVFLSLHLLDFFTDLIMLLMTAAILFSINPWLALATLIPLPIIMWMIHSVRDRLKSDQRARRHHSRHPRGQGLCPGKARVGAFS